MQKYRALIVDDEENSRSNTKSMLQNYCPEIDVVGEAGSGMEGKVKIQELIFRDIYALKRSLFQVYTNRPVLPIPLQIVKPT